MMLTLSKRIMLSDHQMRRSSDYNRRAYMGDDLLERTVGIIGLGNVGTRVAELCKGLFRMRVIAYDPYQTAEQLAAKGAEKAETLEEMLRQADLPNSQRTATSFSDASLVIGSDPFLFQHRKIIADTAIEAA